MNEEKTRATRVAREVHDETVHDVATTKAAMLGFAVLAAMATVVLLLVAIWTSDFETSTRFALSAVVVGLVAASMFAGGRR